MTIIAASPFEYVCLRLVLRLSEVSSSSLSLSQWLARLSSQLGWIPSEEMGRVKKIILVLPDASVYPQLIEASIELISQQSMLTWQGKTFEVLGIETEQHDLFSFTFSIYPYAVLPIHLGRALHALVLHWIEGSDPQLSEQLHQQQNSPFTITIYPGLSGQKELKITLLQKKFLSPLLWGISQDLGKEIKLAQVPCQLGKSIKWFRSSNFQSLLDLPAASSLQLNFVSPTSFKQQEVIQSFPLLELVFDSLLRKWNSFVPVGGELPPCEWKGWVSYYDLKTQVIQLKNRTEIGCIGSVKYQFKEPIQAKIATTLAHFAEFSGVGRKTAMGMGQVKSVNS